MEREEILQWFREHLERDKPLTIPDEIFEALTPAIAAEVAQQYGTFGLIRLPQREQLFFEWLRQQEPPVWEDLWGGEEEPYVVSLAFLPQLVSGWRGFPICDLMSMDNYFFFPAMLEWTAEARDYTAAVKERFAAGESLEVEQLLVLELAFGGAVDMWHFAYHYQLPLDRVKAAVTQLVEDKVLTHLRSAEQLAPFVR
ncbi:MAG: hypothetical protein RMK00_05105 [Bacteroidota bacterium]|nr:hypothetical protein [Bacteroidota bacterium]